jgi:hypothetical protein
VTGISQAPMSTPERCGRSTQHNLVRHTDPTEALKADEGDRLAATSEVVIGDRIDGPESAIDEVERRAPKGSPASRR